MQQREQVEVRFDINMVRKECKHLLEDATERSGPAALLSCTIAARCLTLLLIGVLAYSEAQQGSSKVGQVRSQEQQSFSL